MYQCFQPAGAALAILLIVGLQASLKPVAGFDVTPLIQADPAKADHALLNVPDIFRRLGVCQRALKQPFGPLDVTLRQRLPAPLQRQQHPVPVCSRHLSDHLGLVERAARLVELSLALQRSNQVDQTDE